MDKFSGVLMRLSGLPQQKLSSIAFYSLLVLLCYQLANLTWMVMPSGSTKSTPWRPAPVAQQGSSHQGINLTAITALHLFGEFNKKVAPPPVAAKPKVAPKTKLNVKLTGVLASTVPQNAIAIIEDRGRQDTYFIGNSIGNTGAVLKEIKFDRVILEYRGDLQTLMLDGETYVTNQNSSSQPSAPRAESQTVREAPVKLDLNRAELLANPSKITDFISISPVRNQGALIGYRINPGRDATIFQSAGLQANDLAVSLNGIDLTDMQQSMSLMQEFPTMREMTLSVERDGQIHDLYFSLPE
ncbi:type II secretion system protein GspC [Motilimonas cestriensis]|uniref:Type II secretion system protein GspC n=1 Tax=Motilimonas cestriensis TaxID=2742685 RepID=A0ABS8WBI1_9GAMM|nr:type II secretion system protein GspC [Motilimonas cestriensis]MCE2594755.1 type II secretion system protein GspC [Motilimonas cestriensis]